MRIFLDCDTDVRHRSAIDHLCVSAGDLGRLRFPRGMMNPGWYFDPSSGGDRWWDGMGWTPQTRPVPTGPVVMEKVGSTPVHADGYGLRRGRHFMSWTEIEWITFSNWRHTTTTRGIGGTVTSRTTWGWSFTVGCGDKRLDVTWKNSKWTKPWLQPPAPQGWSSLIDLAGDHQ